MFVFDLSKYSSLLKMEAYWNQVMEVNPAAVTVLVGKSLQLFPALLCPGNTWRCMKHCQ
jgi:hypothetical protein